MNLLHKKYLVILVAMGVTTSLFSQQALVDSMEKLMQKKLPDSVLLLNKVRQAMYYEKVDESKAHLIYEEARQLADKKNLPLYKGLSYRYEATLYNVHGQYTEMLNNLDKAYAIYSRLPQQTVSRELPSLYMDYGNYYSAKNDEKKAAEYYFKSAALLEKTGFKPGLLATYLNLSGLFQRMGQLDEQKDYIDRSLALAKELNKPKFLFRGYVYKAHYFGVKAQYAASLKYLDSANTFYSENWESGDLQTFFIDHAQAYQGLKQYDSAVYYYQLCYDRAKSKNLRWYMVEPLLKIGYVYLLQKKYPQSQQYLKRGLDMAIKDSLVLFQKEGYESMSRVFAETNHYKDAYTYYKTFHSLTDSLVGEDKKKFTLDLQQKYETDKKEQEIKNLLNEKKIQSLELQQKSLLNYLLIASAVILLLAGLGLYRNYSHRQKLQQRRINELETEKKLESTEAVLKGEEQERARLAKDLHDGLSGMLSGAKYSLQTMKGNLVMSPDNQLAFERCMDMLDSSIKEMRRVAQNMMPEALIRFGLDTALKDYCTEINKTGIVTMTYQSMGLEKDALSTTTTIAIYRIVQELVNNVIKHSGASQVFIQVLKEEKSLIINVEDNGNGFVKSILDKSAGMGWNNIRSRIEYLKGITDIQSTPGKGTSINIELNLAA